MFCTIIEQKFDDKKSSLKQKYEKIYILVFLCF